MLLYRTRKNNFLQIFSLVYQILHRIFMCNAYNILLDNRSCIQFRSHIMTGGTNNLHATLKSCMIRFGTHKRRQKGMMYINNAIRISIYHLL